MNKKGLLIVSFGTSHRDALEAAIAAVEREAAAAFPDRVPARAFTSGMIRRKLSKEGTEIFDVPGALAALRAEGVEDLLVLPTHLIPGEEYEKLLGFLAEAEGFAALRVAGPLMRSLEDVDGVLSALSAAVERQEGEALVLMGHGSADKPSANEIYVRLEESFHRLGWTRAFVGTVEGTPDLEDVLGKLSGGDRAAGPAGGSTGEAATTLAPLMIVAGEHAVKDMAGEDPDSWMNRMKAAGYTVEAVKKGLGAYEGVRRMFVRHGRQARPVE